MLSRISFNRSARHRKRLSAALPPLSAAIDTISRQAHTHITCGFIRQCRSASQKKTNNNERSSKEENDQFLEERTFFPFFLLLLLLPRPRSRQSIFSPHRSSPHVFQFINVSSIQRFLIRSRRKARREEKSREWENENNSPPPPRSIETKHSSLDGNRCSFIFDNDHFLVQMLDDQSSFSFQILIFRQHWR